MWHYNPILDAKSDTPVFLQISRSIAADIMRGRLQAGYNLPGSRKLARQLGINRNTVLAAYDALVSEGWVVTRPAGGTYVADSLPQSERCDAPTSQLPEKTGFDMPEFDYTPPFISLMEQGARVKDCLFLAAGVPDPRLFPAAEMARAYRRALLRNTRQSLSIGPAEGHPKAREMLAGMLAAVRGMGVTLDNIQLTRGILVGLGLVARAIVKPGDVVAVENPGYPGAWEVLREVGAQVVPIPVDSEGMKVDALERLLATQPVRAVFVTPHHQYPTTAVMSEPRRSHLMSLARQHRFAIIEDDYDHAFHYEGRPIWPLASRDNSGTVIYLASLSKLMGPGLRVGFVVGPTELIHRLAILRRRMEVQGDIALEMAMAEFSEDGELGRHLRRCKMIYHKRRDVLVDALQRHLGDAVSFEVPKGGLNLWVKLRQGDMDAWADACAREKVIFHTTRRFTFHGERGDSARMCFAALNETELEEAARRMAKALASLHTAPATVSVGARAMH